MEAKVKAQRDWTPWTSKITRTSVLLSRAAWRKKYRLLMQRSRPKRFNSPKAACPKFQWWTAVTHSRQQARRVTGDSETLKNLHSLVRTSQLWVLSVSSNSSNNSLTVTMWLVLKKRRWASMQRDVPTKRRKKRLLKLRTTSNRSNRSSTLWPPMRRKRKMARGRTQQKGQEVVQGKTLLEIREKSSKRLGKREARCQLLAKDNNNPE